MLPWATFLPKRDRVAFVDELTVTLTAVGMDNYWPPVSCFVRRRRQRRFTRTRNSLGVSDARSRPMATLCKLRSSPSYPYATESMARTRRMTPRVIEAGHNRAAGFGPRSGGGDWHLLFQLSLVA